VCLNGLTFLGTLNGPAIITDTDMITNVTGINLGAANNDVTINCPVYTAGAPPRPTPWHGQQPYHWALIAKPDAQLGHVFAGPAVAATCVGKNIRFQRDCRAWE
jgi:hypothetical protein